MQFHLLTNPGLRVGLITALLFGTGCGGSEKPKDGISGTISIDSAPSQSFTADVTVSTTGPNYQFESDSLSAGVRVRLVQNNPTAPMTGNFSASTAQPIAVTFRRAVGQTWVEAPPTAGTIHITQVPTKADPTWVGVLQNVAGTLSTGQTVLIQSGEFRATMQSGWVQ